MEAQYQNNQQTIWEKLKLQIKINKDRKITLYEKQAIFVQLSHVSHIRLKFQKNNDDKLQDHICITPEEQFMKKKKCLVFL